MLANAVEERIFVSNQLMLSKDHNNTDTDFVIDLGSIFSSKRLVLGCAFIENYFLNMLDLSLTVAGTYISLQPDVFLTQGTLIHYLNDVVGALGTFSYGNTLASYDTRLELVCTVPFSLQGISWYRQLGFALNVTSQDLIAETVYSFAQTPMVCLQIQNLPSAVTNGFLFSYQLPNTPGVYGSSLSLSTMNFNSTNMIIFSQQEKFSQLHIVLKDQYGNTLRTPNGNQSNIAIALTFSSYNE